jgi:prepilin-type N-terminal cleavage/methylation domain-containing protein
MKNKGFTLVELMVVIVIVGILAAVAIPKFTRASHKAKASEFPTVLTSIFTSEGAFEAENGCYTDRAGLSDLTIPASRWFSYSVAYTTAPCTFDAEAKVIKAFGDADIDKKAYIDEAGVKTGDAELIKYVKNW